MSAIDTNVYPSQLLQGNLYQSVGNPYDNFISPGVTPGQTSAYQKRRFHTQNFPDSQRDRALMIRDSTEEIMWSYVQQWQLTKVMPLQTANTIHLQLSYFEALPTFFTVTPEQAVGNMLTQTETQHSVQLDRYSLQARLELGFMQTPMGQQRYRAMLQQFAVSLIETAHSLVYEALLTATDPQQTWLARHGELDVEDLQNYMKWDHFVFGALQKIRNDPLEKIDAKVSVLMNRYRGTADSWILGEELEVYASTVPLKKTTYALGGQEAIDRINGRLRTGGDSNKPTPLSHVDPIRMVGSNAVFVVRSFHVEGQNDLDPFKRVRQFGEYNVLQDNIRTGAYENSRRTILLYNQTRDMMSPVTLRDCILNAHVWGEDGYVENLEGAAAASPDAKYDPFVLETNSYDSIKYIGDLARDYLDVDMLKKAAGTMMGAMYADETESLRGITSDLDDAMIEINNRLNGLGDNAYQASWNGVSGNVRAVFEKVAARLSAIAGSSIFLDQSIDGSSAGERLYNALVLSAAVPIYDDNAGLEATTLLETFRGIANRGSDLEATLSTPGMTVDEMIALIRENIDQTSFSEQGVVAFNGFVQRTMREYKQAVGGGARASVPSGFASPQEAKRRASQGGFRDEGSVLDDVFGAGESEDLEARIPVNSTLPVSLWRVPFVAKMIASSMEESSGDQRSRFVNDVDGYDIGGLSTPIGGHVNLGRRRADLSFIPASFRAAGISGLNANQLRLRLGTMARHISDVASSGMSTVRKILALVYLGLPFTKQIMLSLCDNDVLVPVNFIVFRPHAEVETQVICKVASGGDAGYTYYAFSNVMVGDNVLTKTHTINFHFHMKAYVHQPRNLFVVPDVFVTGYRGGLGVGFYVPQDSIEDGDQYDNGVEVTKEKASMICVMVDYKTTRDSLPNPFDITGMWKAGRIRGMRGGVKPHYPTAARYRQKYAFGAVDAMSEFPLLGENAHQNTYMYRGHTEEDDGTGNIIVRPNTGHWGPDVYEGAKRAREGELYSLRDMQYGTGR